MTTTMTMIKDIDGVEYVVTKRNEIVTAWGERRAELFVRKPRGKKEWPAVEYTDKGGAVKVITSCMGIRF